MTAFAALTAATIRMAAPGAAMHEVTPVMTRPEIAVTAEMPDMASTIKMAPPVMVPDHVVGTAMMAEIAPVNPVRARMPMVHDAMVLRLVPMVHGAMMMPVMHRAVVMDAAVPVAVMMVAPVVVPIMPAVIPGPAPIIIIPIAVDVEADDRQIDFRAIVDDRNIAVVIGIGQIVGVDPAAAAGRGHIAPAIATDAAMDEHACALIDGGHHREFGARPGAHMQSNGDSRSVGRGRRRKGETDQKDGGEKSYVSRHFVLPSSAVC